MGNPLNFRWRRNMTGKIWMGGFRKKKIEKRKKETLTATFNNSLFTQQVSNFLF